MTQTWAAASAAQALLFMGWAAASAAATSADLEFFESKVRPLLVEHCAACHSAREGDPEGGLSFDSRADFLAAAGIAVAGMPEESLLVKAVRYDGDLQMPPEGKLPAAAITTLEEWVRRGLPWPDDGTRASGEGFDILARKAEHWCWHAPKAPRPPVVKELRWCRTDIDRFVLARLENAGLSPAAEADRAVLERRASEILTGLPPAPADVDRIVADSDPLAFETFVDELLASSHFGERFARHWLDVVRYGETRGHEFDFAIPNAWQYRDWVARAFNADLPYDRFVREQIAGDLIAEPRLDPRTAANESVVGTGFWLLGEELHAPVDIRQDEADRIDNRVDTFGKAFLGQALGCARCHDHKFDAVSAADYYAIAGMVMSSSYRQVPFETLEHNRGVAARLAELDARMRRDLAPLVASVQSRSRSAADDTPQPPTDSDAVVVADYTGDDGPPLIMDGAAWESVPAGQPVLLPAAKGRPPELRIEPIGHARSDAIWSMTRSTGERDSPPLGSVDRAGRVLRTPKVRLTEGVLWHRVRGAVQIYVVVDGHVLLQKDPLYGPHLMTVDTKGDWKWVRQDLRRDIKDWDTGHVVHVEYAAVDGEAGVATVVAAAQEPVRADPPAAADIDWKTEPARRLVTRAEMFAAARAAILADVRFESATAPALLDGNGLDQHVLLKGSAARPGRLAARRFLEAIDGSAQPAWPQNSSGRMELADRVLDPANPLTSRVIVNRVWHHLFGRGLVATTDNFGKLGEAPADPEAQALLDTLAVRFREQGWSVKRLVREIVTSSVWRMSSTCDPAAIEKDPLNHVLHHYPLRRLESEAIRDKLLAVSGQLIRTVGGPSVEPFLTDFQDGRGKGPSGPLDGAGRRSLYIKIRRNFLPSFLTTFDMPVPFQAMGRRTVTNVPAQSLTLMNDPFVVDQAAIWARRALADETLTPTARIEGMYREAFARRPTAAEMAAAQDFLTEQAGLHGGDFAADPRHAAAWADLAHVLVNTKEFIFIP
ncbi:MAG: PSD1 and planctomycete cytochrome C domain-containing protein [Pirellulales bacterium]